MSCGTPCSLCHPGWLGLKEQEPGFLDTYADGLVYSGSSRAQQGRRFKLCGGCLRRVFGDRDPPEPEPVTRQRRLNDVDQLPLPIENTGNESITA